MSVIDEQVLTEVNGLACRTPSGVYCNQVWVALLHNIEGICKC
jgi:hypothetical protein